MRNRLKTFLSLLTLFALAGCSSPASSYPTSSSQPASSSASQSAVQVAGVTLNKDSLILEMGKSEKLVATVLPSNASNKGLSWSSSDEGIASVSSDGLVSAIQPGEATITAKTEEGGFVATCDLTVVEKEGCYYTAVTEFDICDYQGRHTATDHIRIITTVKNVGTVNMFLDSCTYDVLTEAGEPVQSITYSYVLESPCLVEPGDYGYFTTVTSLAEARTDITVTPHPVIKNGKGHEAKTYDVSDISFGESDAFTHHLTVKGKVTNNTSKQASGLDQVAILLFDKNDAFLSAYWTVLPVAIKPGESCVFEATNLGFGWLDIQKEDVGRIMALAFVWDYVY